MTMNDISKSFALDKQQAKFLGVCAGLARTLDVDPLWIRLAFVVSVLAGFGLPLILYFVIALLAK
ncbi:PspC domain-containing protein [Pseudonocardia sp. TMWB2A]|uniref:PspC domain-containing protein n=1 Tax=Pseudonocardia sp. TMWB2A TaxID=687430 RepID=UPI00307E2E5F